MLEMHVLPFAICVLHDTGPSADGMEGALIALSGKVRMQRTNSPFLSVNGLFQVAADKIAAVERFWWCHAWHLLGSRARAT